MGGRVFNIALGQTQPGLDGLGLGEGPGVQPGEGGGAGQRVAWNRISIFMNTTRGEYSQC